ncbi:type III pantothenate kinase [Ectothiorhodospira sp. A-7Y]|nr:type III pantothenate kinase [Ectothiorhodospira lacustris]MCG5522614.1 type III pantothenate kinase [Ectothiorhodospira lacustris]
MPGASGGVAHGGSDWADLPRRLDAALGSVTPEAVWVVEVLGHDFRCACRELCEVRGWPVPRFFSSDPALHGIYSDYLEPARLGLDRYAAMAGARALGHETAIIVDCGTAVTLDLLVPEGRHRGGLILPGLGLMRRSLGRAPGVAGMTEGKDDCHVAVCTADAVASGTLQGLAAAIAHLSRGLLKNMGADGVAPARLLTGGDARHLQPLLDDDWSVEPHLVFRGLAHVADRD